MSLDNTQVEHWVIGGLLDAESKVLRSTAGQLIDASGLSKDDFTHPGLAVYFEAIKTISDRNRPADPQTVYAVCKGLDGITPKSLELMRTLQGANVANREAFMGHCEELRRLSLLRKLESFHAKQLAELSNPRPDPKAMTTAVEAFSASFSASTQQDETGESDLMALADDWDAFVRGERHPYLATGIDVLDANLGGFVANLNVVGGLPSVGKSAFIAEFIYQSLGKGMKLGLFGLEDATKWVAKRLLSRQIGIPVSQVTASRLNEHQQELCDASFNRLHPLLKNLHVYRRAGIDPATLVQKCKHWIINKGVQAIVIDHGGEVQHESAAARDRHDLAVAKTYQALRDIAVNHQVPIVVLCHFNRDTDKLQGGVPKLINFAETRYIEAMARVALGLWSKEGDPRLRCTILKRTEGERGITVAIERDVQSALVKSKGGEVIDLRQEAEYERSAAEAAKSEARRARQPSGWKNDSF